MSDQFWIGVATYAIGLGTGLWIAFWDGDGDGDKIVLVSLFWPIALCCAVGCVPLVGVVILCEKVLGPWRSRLIANRAQRKAEKAHQEMCQKNAEKDAWDNPKRHSLTYRG